MIIKLTLCGLFILLVAVIVMSYYSNKEGFEDITNSSIKSNLSLDDLTKGTVNTLSNKLPTEPSSSSTVSITPEVPNSVVPERTEVVPEVSVSKSGYDAMMLQQKMDLLKDIQKVVRNELIASRTTEPVGMIEKSGKKTDSTAQGEEYSDSCYKDTEYRCPKNPDGSCPPLPDMTKYIKKDEIPCWGCSVDY